MTEQLRKYIDQYQLNVDGVEFWAPYYISQRRENVNGDPVVGPFKGRGTPQEIFSCLQELLKPEGVRFDTAEGYRAFMSTHRLGVECSGFAFYVLDSVLRASGERLQDNLYKSKSEMIAVYDNPKLAPPAGLARTQVEAYPDWVSLTEIHDDWGNVPRNVVQSQTFWNEGSSIPVKLSELGPGDLIGMMGHDGVGHHVIVVSVEGDTITYAHSGGTHGRPDYYGGVEYGAITIIDPVKPIEQQLWQGNGRLILDTHTFDSQPLRRLRVFADNA